MLTKASQRARNLSRRLDNSFEQALIEVWRQVLVENNKAVHAGHRARYLVRRALKRGLRPLDFMFDGNEIRGLEQNPQTKSWWAQLARSGKEVSVAARKAAPDPRLCRRHQCNLVMVM